MNCRAWLPKVLIIAIVPGVLAQDAAQSPLFSQPQSPANDQKPTASGGVADIAIQGYYLGGASQPLTDLSGMTVSFREYVPAIGLLTGNFEGYIESTRGRIGQNSVTLNGLKWKGRRWNVTGGDFTFRTGLVPTPFTNYSYPEVGVRGARVEMTDGNRQFTFFAGEETLQEGPRITFRLSAPQTATGAAMVQHIGSRLLVGVRYLGLSSTESQIAANPSFFPEGSLFRRTDSLSVQTVWSAGHCVTLFADTEATRAEFTELALYPRAAPFSWLGGAKWKAGRLTLTANYGSLSHSALPVLGTYFGDRRGPFAELQYRVFRSVQLFGSALRSQNNREADPSVVNLTAQNLTVGLNVTLPGNTGLSSQYAILGLRGELPSDPSQNQAQRNTQSQVSLNKAVAKHNLLFTARDLNLASQNFAEGVNVLQKQRSAEMQDDVSFSVFGLGGAVRMQQESGGGQLQNSVFVRASGRVRLRNFSFYGQFEAGNDLINKTLFATNSVKTTVAGVEIPIDRLARGWTLRAEAFRTTLLSMLNPANILVLQTQGTDVSQLLNNFDQWSFYLRLSHHTHWGVPPPEVEATSNQVVYGTIEGFVFDDATGTHGAADVSVQLDKSRTATTDSTGRYRFDNVPEGAHAVALNLAELAADYSPGPPPPASILVRPRAIARVDLRVVQAGSFVRGVVEGLAKDDIGVVRLQDIVVTLEPTEGDKPASETSCDGGGAFAFYNLTAGRYRVSVAQATLPEDYVIVSDSEVEVDPSAASGQAGLVFRMEKHVKELPVRRVFESELR